MSLSVCVVRLVSKTVNACSFVERLVSSCGDLSGCILIVVGWRRRVQCACFLSTRAHTPLKKKKKKKKKIAPAISVVVVTRRVITRCHFTLLFK
jgi:hypothetical protein